MCAYNIIHALTYTGTSMPETICMYKLLLDLCISQFAVNELFIRKNVYVMMIADYMMQFASRQTRSVPSRLKLHQVLQHLSRHTN